MGLPNDLAHKRRHSDEDLSSFTGEIPITKPQNDFPIHLQSSNIFRSSCKMTVSNNLFYAVLKARFQKTRFLLERGLSVNCRNDFGYNVLVAALHIEDDRKREKMFSLLLREGADPSRRDYHHGRNTLAWACLLGREKEALLLLDDYGGDFDLFEKDCDGLSSLHHATHSRSMDTIRCLVKTLQKYRLSVDVPDNQGMTPYVLARRLGFKEIADFLRFEGNASPSTFDTLCFKSPREWSQIGRFERQMDERQRKREERNQAKIEGRVYFRPGYVNKPNASESVTSVIPENEVINDKLFEKRKLVEVIDHQQPPRDTVSLPAETASLESTPTKFPPRPTSDELDGRKRRGSVSVGISLLDLSGSQRGKIANTFHHSQLDTSKASEYSDMLGGINTLMTILSQEQSSSFRKFAIPEPPPVEKVPQKVKSKVSTLAILFGKDSSRGKRSGRKGKTGKDIADKRKRKVIGKSKNALLPDIRVNNRVL